MIKLDRPSAPVQLTDDMKAVLTAEYHASGASVWRQDYIVDRLLAMSFSKCAYCETKIDEESKYLEVDHIAVKSTWPELVVEWNNLLPSCKRCNVRKGRHDVAKDGPLLDPTLNEPRLHLRHHLYRLVGKDELGRRTVDVIYLNDSARLLQPRMKVGESIMTALAQIRDRLELYASAPTASRLTRVMNSLEGLLNECVPDAAFAAIAATIMLEHEDYKWIRDQLKGLGHWERFSAAEAQAQSIALD